MTASQFGFRKYQFISLRLWHWSNSVVILGLLATVVIRKTFLSWRANSALIQEKLSAAGNPISPELAKEIAVAIRDPLWDWHIYFGFALGILFLARILIALFIEKQFPAGSAIKGVLSIKDVPATQRPAALHFFFVKIGYFIFYLVTALMVVSGFLLTYKSDFGLSKNLSDMLKEAHELMMWFFVVFIGGHLIGIVFAENRTDPGLVSDMIHGGKSET